MAEEEFSTVANAPKPVLVQDRCSECTDAGSSDEVGRDTPNASQDGYSSSPEECLEILESKYSTPVVTICIGLPTVEFKVHQGVLHQSPVLSRSYTEFPDGPPLKFYDVSKKTFLQMIDYLYTGTYRSLYEDSLLQSLSDTERCKEFTIHAELFSLASRCELGGLVGLTIQNMKKVGAFDFRLLLVVAKRIYRTIGSKDTWFSGYVKQAASKAFADEPSLAEEQFILDVFRYDAGRLAVDLFTVFVAKSTPNADSTEETPSILSPSTALSSENNVCPRRTVHLRCLNDKSLWKICRACAREQCVKVSGSHAVTHVAFNDVLPAIHPENIARASAKIENATRTAFWEVVERLPAVTTIKAEILQAKKDDPNFQCPDQAQHYTRSSQGLRWEDCPNCVRDRVWILGRFRQITYGEGLGLRGPELFSTKERGRNLESGNPCFLYPPPPVAIGSEPSIEAPPRPASPPSTINESSTAVCSIVDTRARNNSNCSLNDFWPNKDKSHKNKEKIISSCSFTESDEKMIENATQAEIVGSRDPEAPELEVCDGWASFALKKKKKKAKFLSAFDVPDSEIEISTNGATEPPEIAVPVSDAIDVWGGFSAKKKKKSKKANLEAPGELVSGSGVAVKIVDTIVPAPEFDDGWGSFASKKDKKMKAELLESESPFGKLVAVNDIPDTPIPAPEVDDDCWGYVPTKAKKKETKAKFLEREDPVSEPTDVTEIPGPTIQVPEVDDGWGFTCKRDRRKKTKAVVAENSFGELGFETIGADSVDSTSSDLKLDMFGFRSRSKGKENENNASIFEVPIPEPENAVFEHQLDATVDHDSATSATELHWGSLGQPMKGKKQKGRTHQSDSNDRFRIHSTQAAIMNSSDLATFSDEPMPETMTDEPQGATLTYCQNCGRDNNRSPPPCSPRNEEISTTSPVDVQLIEAPNSVSPGVTSQSSSPSVEPNGEPWPAWSLSKNGSFFIETSIPMDIKAVTAPDSEVSKINTPDVQLDDPFGPASMFENFSSYSGTWRRKRDRRMNRPDLPPFEHGVHPSSPWVVSTATTEVPAVEPCGPPELVEEEEKVMDESDAWLKRMKERKCSPA